MNLLDKEFAKIILGAAVIDDILALLVLSMVQNVPSTFSTQTLAPFAGILFTAIVFLIGGIKVGQYVVKKYFDKSLEGEVDKIVFLGVLAYVLAYAYIAEFIGLSAIVGAFVAGITLNYSRLTKKLFELFYPLEAFFTPLFFISLGLFVNVTALKDNFLSIILVTIIAVLAKLVGCFLPAKALGASSRDSLLVGVGMVPRGEIALIIGLYGLTAIAPSGEPMLSQAEYVVIASMAFLTTLFVPWLLQKILALEASAMK